LIGFIIMKLEKLVESKDENKDIGKAPPEGSAPENYVTTAQAAKMLGVTMGRIRQFIQEGRLKSKAPTKGRRDNLIKTSTVKAFKEKKRERTGRPKGT
jgi:excisionase family DNA binding protein